MAAVFSTMPPLGSYAPDFNLPDTISGNMFSLAEIRGKSATMIIFICNHCPFVKHIATALAELARDYANTDIGIVAISPNDADTYPEDSPDNMKLFAKENDFIFPYLYDETQETARAYGAACTPDIFIYDADMRLAYRGQLDDSRPTNGQPVTGADVRNALDALLAGQSITKNQIPSIGCSIKWKGKK